MPNELAQYGVAVFAVGGLIYILDRWLKSRNQDNLAEVVENNTKVLESLTDAIQTLTTTIQVQLTRQEAKIDELLERARR